MNNVDSKGHLCLHNAGKGCLEKVGQCEERSREANLRATEGTGLSFTLSLDRYQCSDWLCSLLVPASPVWVASASCVCV